MNQSDRFRSLLRFERIDRLPRVEWAPWWNQTIERWRDEGLPFEVPRSMTEHTRIQQHFGLDLLCRLRTVSQAPTFPKLPRGVGPVTDMRSYEAIRPHLYPAINMEAALPQWLREAHRSGEAAVWFVLEGFFWFPRKMFGIQEHFYAFYDHPDVMHRINADHIEHHKYLLRSITNVLQPEFMTFAEDMSYNHGPMLSESMFDEFMAPYYREMVPLVKAHDIVPFVDSDGNIEQCASWFMRCGIQGMLPLERQSGVDVARLRERCPDLRMIGAFDKMTMDRGTEAMRAEWDRLLPTIRLGGFAPSVDHQTPPGVSLAQYREFLALMWEYTERAN